ncbi:hypothetical protein RhiirA4_474453 [Rhizophagus irregularis]|uniref:Uncharacterized protein n=1 Tax=Rhizophagus irregularis TaxID=588596 RepID=A0A2I1H8F5_9GLOM|nr:hypothetical protein RhiirA4_474453 [Rhizophagus irregularis]
MELYSLYNETNEHLWMCREVIKLLIPHLKAYYFKESFNHCEVFNWFNSDFSTVQDKKHLHIILLNLVPKEMVSPFNAAIKSKKRITFKHYNDKITDFKHLIQI